MRILLLGATGMLGQAIRREADERGHQIVGVARSGAEHPLDMRESDGLRALIADVPCDVAIDAVAITDLAACERDPGDAYMVNARPAALLAELLTPDSRLVYVSTDQFYVGDGHAAHTETEPVVLVNEYARTKYAGEHLALTRPGSLVVRTNIVGFRGWSRPTFVESMVRALRASDALTLFDDFFTSSIEVGACARAILDLVAADAAGTVNVASRSVTSKLEFVSLLAQAVDLEPSYTPGSVRQLAPRRAESAGLDVRRAEDLLGRPMPDARETVAALAGDARCAT